jgi:thiosulfate dehydrogenase
MQVNRHTISISVISFTCAAMIFSCNNEKVVVDKQAVAESNTKPNVSRNIPADAWKAPDSTAIPPGEAGKMIRYGKELITHTANYFGPKGSIAQISNGMNCQNCHLDGGSRLFGNNYSVFMATYPKWSDRGGKLQPATGRIRDCFIRSLAGQSPDTTGYEVRAMLAYMKWMGRGIKTGQKLFGTSTEKLDYIARAADPVKGKMVFISKCKVCHGIDGQGLLAADKKSYTYPPLWGWHSYNDGAGIYRVSNLAGFVKNNMPFGATYQNPQLTNEQAWDVAAFVDSQPRPHYDQSKDWKNIKTKPIDFPFGPYADKFSEKQHKYGPYQPIKAARKELAGKKA